MEEEKFSVHKGFREGIKNYCEEAKLPLYALAYRLGKSPAVLSHVTSNIRNFPRNNKFLKELAALIGYSGPLLECDECEKRQVEKLTQ